MLITPYIQSIYDELLKNENLLNNLDAAIGDGDHGSNIVRGFNAILTRSSSFTSTSTIDKDLLICAQELMSKIGGSSGPLLGSGFMALAMSLKDKTTFDVSTICNALQNAFNKISQLGQSHVGEKTMLDALQPAIDVLKNEKTLDLNKIYLAAKKGADDTIPIVATKGRASYLGERSKNHMDPGACSIALIFKAIAETKPNQKLAVNSDVNNKQEQVKNNVSTLKPISKLVNILLVSHSYQLAKATVDFISEMKQNDFKLDFVAGVDNGKRFGTDPNEIKNKINSLITDSELLIIYDLGSSKMNTEVAIGMLDEQSKQRVQVCSIAFVEGSLTAVVSNNFKNALQLKEVVESQTRIEK